VCINSCFTGLTAVNAYIHKNQETITNLEATVAAKDVQTPIFLPKSSFFFLSQQFLHCQQLQSIACHLPTLPQLPQVRTEKLPFCFILSFAISNPKTRPTSL